MANVYSHTCMHELFWLKTLTHLIWSNQPTLRIKACTVYSESYFCAKRCESQKYSWDNSPDELSHRQRNL